MQVYEKDLPSGAKLKINLAPFADGKALFQAVCKELKDLKLAQDTQIDLILLKDLFCLGMSSKEVDATLAKCMERALYNNVRITPETFEPETARQDYVPALLEVAQINLAPFTKSLMHKLSEVASALTSSQGR